MAACASLASLCAATAVQQANAQAVSVASALEEITVTARRREESLQDIPVAVSAFSDEELRALQADNLSALSGAVPNLNLVQGRGSATSANVFIRGIGQPDALQTFDPAAGVYVDDIYMSRIQGALFELYDVERVEVLRGPQGTLYGKNTIAGAIKLVSKRPSDELTGQIELMGGDYDRFDLKAYVSGPLSDTVSFSLAGLTSNRDGIVADPATGKEYNDIDTQAGRAILRFAPSDRFDATVSLDYTRQRNALTLGRNEADLIAVDLAPITAPPVVVLTPARTGEFDYRTRTSFANDEGQTLDHWGGSLTLNWHLGDAWSFKSITAYRELEPDLYIDIDATEFELGDVFVGIDQDQLSQEFQLLFDGGGRWQAVFGLYYLDENVESLQLAFADDFLRFNGTPLPFERMVGDELENKSYAAFAHVSVDLTDRLSGSLGVRYTQDEKDYFRTTTTNLDPTPFDYVDDDSWDAVTPSATLEYAFTPDAMTYLSVARGFKSGGFNGRANSVADTGSFDPEYVWTYELGYKGQWNGGRLTTNAAVFYSDYTDFQARVGDADPLGFRFPVLNAGELEIYGAELEVVAVPVDALQLRAAIGYLSADYKEFEDCRPQYGPDCDHSGEEPPFAPEWTAGLGLSYTIPLTVRTALTFGVDGNFKAKHWLSVDNRDVLTQDDFWLVNALATLRGTDGGWWVSVGGKNLTDEVYKTDAQEFAAVGNIQTAYYGDPRTWSIALGFAF
jgi:iron complex outermembrane receptor protein